MVSNDVGDAHGPGPAPSGRAATLALWISHGLSPAGIAVLVLAWAGGAGWAVWADALIGVALLGVAPALVLRVLAARAGLRDVFDPPAALRQRMLMFGAGCYAAGWGAGLGLGLGPVLAWVGATFTAGAVVVWGIDRFWKISIHNTAAGGGAVLLGGLTPAWMLPLCWALPVIVGWARWRRGAHSVAQLVAGAALGAAVGWLLRHLAGPLQGMAR